MGLPRHLSQHVGGFVLTQGKLTRLVPVENAAMPDRSVIQWEKDDLDAMGLLKVDVLALGMLSAIRRCLDLIGAQRGATFQMQDIPAEDPATYDMICAADTVGVFQIESRAQMSMLPRLKPRCFYDLVIEVAIVRPGPIQGGMVHPYLQRRQGLVPVDYPGEGLRAALERTLGVPIFQEQVMQIAMLAAGFSAGESDSLRRSMAAWKRKGGVHRFHDRMISGMVANGYTEEFAEGIFKQMEGFGEYGFPESHAASFALLVYVSCWLKHHEPACFLAAMLNSQPLGFYSPSQLVQDAQRHGVVVRAVDVMCSDWDCTMEDTDAPGYAAERVARPAPDARAADARPAWRAVRLGLRMVSGLATAAALRIVEARAEAPFTSTEDLALRAALDQGDLKALASADALHQPVGPPPPAGVGRVRAAAGTGPAQDRAGRGGFSGAAPGLGGRGGGVRLRRHRSHAAHASGRSAARGVVGHEAAHRRRTARPARRPPGARLRHRGHAPAAPDRQGRGLRHAGGRDRQRQRDRLEKPAREAAQRAVARPADGRVGRVAARCGEWRRGAPPDRAAAGGPHAAAGGAGDAQPGVSLSAARVGAAVMQRLWAPTASRSGCRRPPSWRSSRR
jgi:hypothetical protein